MSDFRLMFGADPQGVWAGPGRVNLIGEHTDYNDGFVLPFAIDRRAIVTMRLRDDDVIRCASRQQGDVVESHQLADLKPLAGGGWSSYLLGVAWALGVETGFDVMVDSDVPIGAGLSSSAALETATAFALSDLLALDQSPQQLAMACHRAETEFVGAPVGVMDQMVSAAAVKGHALLLDCRTHEIEQVPFHPGALGCGVLVIDTKTQHTNADGPYAERRATCETAAADLGVAALRDATAEQVADAPRARHVVSENARVLETVEALRAGDAVRVGALMTASHASLRDDFDVSCPELDVAVDAALSAGALGARLTGAGFGGSAIALVPVGRAGAVTAAVQHAFIAHRFDLPHVFGVTPGPGASRIT